MNNNEDEKIQNILRLKQEMERELQKLGKLKKRQQHEKHKTPADFKVKIDVHKDLYIPVENVKSVYDIDFYAYGEDVKEIIGTVKRKIGAVQDPRHRHLLSGIVSLLQGDYSFKPNFTGDQWDVYLKCVHVILNYRNDPRLALERATNLIKENGLVPEALLTTAEVLLAFGKYPEATVLMRAVEKIRNDPYISLVMDLYQGKEQETISTCIARGGYKILILILSVFIEGKEKINKIAGILPRKRNACARYLMARWKGTDLSAEYPFCDRMVILSEALKYADGKEIDYSRLRVISNRDPQAIVLMLLHSISKNNLRQSAELAFHLLRSVGEVGVSSIRSRGSFGVENFVDIVKNEAPSDHIKDAETLIQKLVELRNDTSKSPLITYRDPEILRLYFGERHCKACAGRC